MFFEQNLVFLVLRVFEYGRQNCAYLLNWNADVLHTFEKVCIFFFTFFLSLFCFLCPEWIVYWVVETELFIIWSSHFYNFLASIPTHPSSNSAFCTWVAQSIRTGTTFCAFTSTQSTKHTVPAFPELYSESSMHFWNSDSN